MRTRRDIEPPFVGDSDNTPGSSAALEAQLLPHEAVPLAAVRAPLGLAHHEADDGADRLRLAAPQLLDGLGVGLEGAVDDRAELVRARHAERALLDDLLGIAALLGQHVEHGLARGLRDRL